jgi:anionic cell wall polymer biosynthesis LytR-Cps2A-Psr (LCP) family protein
VFDKKLFLKTQLFTLLFFFLFVFLTGVAFLIFGFFKFRGFSRESGLGIGQVHSIAREGWNLEPTSTDGYKNILILGLDSLETRGDSPALTDTIILASVNFKSGEIGTFSLPRDLWNDDYITRINALYFYGLEKYPNNPEKFPREVLEEMTGLEIHQTLVLSFEQVSEVIDLLGGLEIDVPVAFIDEEFPRPDVDVTVERDPAKLYKTIEFEKGKQTMNGEEALEYIRSRKSGDDEGTDVARGTRQQLVIEALISKVKQKDTIYNFKLMGQLYKYYDDNFSDVFSPQELVALGRKLYPIRDSIKFTSNVPSIYPEDKNGVIWHPPVWQYKGEWVYALRNPEVFKLEVKDKLLN